MAEIVLQTKTLPQPLLQFIYTEKVKVREHNGEIHLIPIEENLTAGDCPLLGLYAGGRLTVEKHHAWSREDKKHEDDE